MKTFSKALMKQFNRGGLPLFLKGPGNVIDAREVSWCGVSSNLSWPLLGNLLHSHHDLRGRDFIYILLPPPPAPLACDLLKGLAYLTQTRHLVCSL